MSHQRKSNLDLLTITGQVTVHFTTGQPISGQIEDQDDLHIFIKTRNGPALVPRQQIRYIQGAPNAQVGPALSVDSPQAATQRASEFSPQTNYAAHDEARQTSLQDRSDILPPKEPATIQPTFGPDDSDATFVLPMDTRLDDLDEIEGTIVLDSQQIVNFDDEPGTIVLDSQQMANFELDDQDAGTIMLPTNEVGFDDDESDTFVLTPDEMPQSASLSKLVCTSGPHSGQVFDLTEDVISIGRASTNPIALYQDKEASRRHSLVRRDGKNFIIQDQGSLNGTFVNGEPVTGSRTLRQGDVILVGISNLEYQED